MMKYVKIWWRILGMSVMVRASYRISMLVGFVSEFLYILVYLLFINVLFEVSGIEYLVGFVKTDYYLMLLLSDILLFVAFINIVPSVHRLANYIHSGMLDMMLVKPVNPMCMSLIHNSWLLDGVVIVLMNCCLFFYIYFLYGYNIGYYGWFLLMVVMVMSFLIYSTMFFIASLTWFYWPKFGALRWFLGNVYEIIRFPRIIYPGWIQIVLLFMFPVFFVVNPAYDVLAGTYSLDFFILSVGVLYVFVVIAWVMFEKGLERYESAA